MSEIMEDIAYLSQEIGPRPAGTEEEQQAAIYISDMMKKRTGLETITEDFSCNPKPELINVILCAIAILLSIAAMIKNIVVIPAILVGILCAVFFVLEVTGRPLLSKLFARGVSQNVVSKYQPVGGLSGRTRKIILVSNYDSGKVRKDLKMPAAVPVVKALYSAAVVAIPVIWILRAIFALGATGTAAIAWNVVTAIVLLIAALPIIFFIIKQTAEYNEAANCNAASVALMMEVAKRITNPTGEEATSTENVQIHGEQAAQEEGLIPEGATIAYAAPVVTDSATEQTPVSVPEPENDSSTQVTEVIAINTPEQTEESFVYIDEGLGWPEEFSYNAEEEAAPPDSIVEEQKKPSVPEWFTKAQAKANRSAVDTVPIRRSRFASALDQAVETSHARAQEAAAAQRAARAAALASYHEAARLATRPGAQASQDSEGSAEETNLSEDAVSTLNDDQVYGQEVEQRAFEQPISEAPAVNQSFEAHKEEVANKSSLAYVAQRARAAAIAKGDVIEPVQQPSIQEPVRETVAIPLINMNEMYEEAELVRNQLDSENDPLSAFPEPLEPTGEEPRSFAAHAITRNPILDDPNMIADLPQIDSGMPQRAPLAEDPAASSQSADVSRVNLDAFGISTAGNAEPIDNKRAALRNMLPSLSGSITLEPFAEDDESGTVSRTGSFAPVGLSGSIGPVGDELIDGVDPEEIYVDDVDDSDYATTMTETGAYAGPGYVEMPESRTSQFFGRFRRKKDKQEEVSTQQWLNVEDDFDPVQVGTERGSWESFNKEKREKIKDAKDAFFDDEQGEDWNGGAFSKVREQAAKLGKKKKDNSEAIAQGSLEETIANDEIVEQAETANIEQFAEAPVIDEPTQNHPKSSLAAIASMYSSDENEQDVQVEVEQIEDFHLKSVDVEVWFVALGSENASNGGAKAFFAEHANELGGALIINLDGVGAGAFSQIGTEGLFGAKTASPRLKRLVKKAQQLTGVTFANTPIRWRDSIASLALKRGVHAITLAGMEGAKPAYMGQGDDVIENVEEETLYRRAEFIEALIRHV